MSSGRTELTSFVQISNLKAEVPTHEVTAQSFDLFTHNERIEPQSEYDQLQDFHKRMDRLQQERKKGDVERL